MVKPIGDFETEEESRKRLEKERDEFFKRPKNLKLWIKCLKAKDVEKEKKYFMEILQREKNWLEESIKEERKRLENIKRSLG